MADPRINVILGAKDDASKVVKGLRGQFETFKRDAMTGFGLGAGIGVFGLAKDALRGVVDTAGDAIEAASDLAESQDKVDAVFGDSAEAVHDWANELDSSFGLTIQKAEESVGMFGNFTKSLGLTDDKALEVSTTLSELAGDLASFNNIDVSDVLVSLRSGLAGEAEPMRRLGSDVSAARVETILLANGIEKVNGKFTEGQKVLGRYEAIMADTTLAQGDAARTTDTLAGRQRILEKEMGDAMATIGESLLPVVTSLTELAGNVIPLVVEGLGDIGDAANDLVDGLSGIGRAQAEATTETEMYAKRLEVEHDLLLTVMNDLEDSERLMLQLATAQEEAEQTGAKFVAMQSESILAYNEVQEALEAQGEATADLSEADLKLAAAGAIALNLTQRQARAAGLAAPATRDSAKAAGENATAIDEAAEGHSFFATATKAAATEAARLASDFIAGRKASEELGEAIEHVADTSFADVEQAANEAKDAIKAAFDDPVPTIQKLREEEERLTRQRRRANRQGRFDIVAMIDQRRAEIAEQIGHRQKVNAHYRAERAEQQQRKADLKTLRQKFGVTKQKAIEMWKAAGKEITIAIDNEQALRDIEEIRRRYEQVAAQVSGLKSRRTGHSTPPKKEPPLPRKRNPREHSGGVIAPGETAVIRQNEAVLTPSSRTQIVPLDGPNAARGGGGNVYLDGYLVGKIMDDQMGRQYGNASRVTNYRRSN